MKYFLLIVAIAFLPSCRSELDISQIDFTAEACFGECPIFDISISKDGTAKYNAKMFNNQQGQFFATIRKPQLDSLIILIEKARFFSFRDNYTTSWTDQPTYYLTVKLKDGRTKTIKDYGPTGPDKLKKIYRLIFSLRKTQEWR